MAETTPNGNGRQRLFDARLMVQIAALVITLAISAAVTYATFSVHLAVVTTKLDYLTGRVAGLEAHIDKLDDRIDNLP